MQAPGITVRFGIGGGCDGYISRRDAEEKRAANANRGFSSLLREVQNGEEITILSRGTPVARIISVNSGVLPKNEMKKILLSRLKAQRVTGFRNWTRDELYGDS